MKGLIDRLEVDEARMTANLEATRGLVFSQAVLLALIEDQGISRDDAYRIVQRNATKAWEGAGSFQDQLEADAAVRLDQDRLKRCFNLVDHLEHSRVVFERLEALEV